MTDTDRETLIAEEPQDAAAPAAPRRRRPWWAKLLIGLGAVVAMLVVLGVLLFNFGGMWGSADPTMAPQFASMVAAGQTKPVSARFVIPIPGCICHSKDPVQTAVHRTYRMSECSSCHGNSAQNSQ